MITEIQNVISSPSNNLHTSDKLDKEKVRLYCGYKLSDVQITSQELPE